MKELKFNGDIDAQERLAKAQTAIDDYSKSHPNEFSEEEHKEFRSLLNERASALSSATGMNIHSICEDDN